MFLYLIVVATCSVFDYLVSGRQTRGKRFTFKTDIICGRKGWYNAHYLTQNSRSQ